MEEHGSRTDALIGFMSRPASTVLPYRHAFLALQSDNCMTLNAGRR